MQFQVHVHAVGKTRSLADFWTGVSVARGCWRVASSSSLPGEPPCGAAHTPATAPMGTSGQVGKTRPDMKECLCDSTHVTLRQRCVGWGTRPTYHTRHDMGGARSRQRRTRSARKSAVPQNRCLPTGDGVVSLKCWPPSYPCGADLHNQ